MALQLEKEVISGVTYECVQFPCRKSLKILTSIGQLVGGPLAMMLGADDIKGMKEGNFSSKNEKIIGEVVSQIAKQLDDDKIFNLLLEILSGVIATENKEIGATGGKLDGQTALDAHFKGGSGLARMFKVVIFALKTNYTDFLGEITGMLGQVQKK